MQKYRIVRSGRKTLAVEVTKDIEIIVRAPYAVSEKRISKFVLEREAWILKSIEKMRERSLRFAELSEEEISELRVLAKTVLPEKVEKYAKIMGLYPTNVKINSAKTRYGSCSAENSINFSWRLMKFPEPAVDYVVVHELAHIAEKNHGPAFYRIIESVFPDYRERRKLLK